MMEIVYAHGTKGRKKLLKGALEVGKLVGMSFGPFGRNAIIKTKYSAPNITNDGVSIAREIMLEDDIEDLGAQALIEGSMKTDERAGDGTTGTVILATKALSDYAQKIEDEDKKQNGIMPTTDNLEVSTANVNKMAREILDTGKEVVEKLKEMARPIKKDELRNVIATSLGTIFPEYVDVIAETVQDVGKDGLISVDDNWRTRYGIEVEKADGMKFLGTYVTPYMVTNNNKESVYEDVPVLVCNFDISTLTVFLRNAQSPTSVWSDFHAKGVRKIALVLNKAETPLVTALAKQCLQARSGNTSMIDYLVIKAPSLTSQQLEDVAVYCGAKFFDKNTGVELKTAQMSDFGFAKKIVVNEDEVNIVGGAGTKKLVAERVELIKNQIETEKDPAFKKQTERRLGSLQAAFAVIRVGASTEMERVIVKKKIEDAVRAAKCALEEGVLPGGGQALKKIAEDLGEKHPLYGTFMEPYNQIQKTAGGSLKIPPTILDPLKVIRIQVEVALSVAASLITAEVGIAEKKKDLVDELNKKLYPREWGEENFRNRHPDEDGFR